MTEVSNAFITVIIIVIAGVLIFVVPIMSIAARNDITSSQTVQSAITKFVDHVAETAKVTQADYDQLLEELDSTGNAYETNITIYYLDENPAKKTSSNVSDSIKIGENVYYVKYTTQIEEAFATSDDGVIKLEAGDYIEASAENINETFYQTMIKFIYGLTGAEEGAINGSYARLVVTSAEGYQATSN